MTATLEATAVSALNDDAMYEIFVARDAAYDGVFFTGVLTTGVYCLASCRARRPLRRNVRFFAGAEAARAAGLRPCRRCHPDDFARGYEPALEQIEALAAEVRDDPSRFEDVAALVRRSGYGATRLFQLFRQRFDMTPAAFLLEVRVARARRLLSETDLPVADVAAEAGFGALSAFHQHFKRHTGLTPSAYRASHKAAPVAGARSS